MTTPTHVSPRIKSQSNDSGPSGNAARSETGTKQLSRLAAMAQDAQTTVMAESLQAKADASVMVQGAAARNGHPIQAMKFSRWSGMAGWQFWASYSEQELKLNNLEKSIRLWIVWARGGFGEEDFEITASLDDIFAAEQKLTEIAETSYEEKGYEAAESALKSLQSRVESWFTASPPPAVKIGKQEEEDQLTEADLVKLDTADQSIIKAMGSRRTEEKLHREGKALNRERRRILKEKDGGALAKFYGDLENYLGFDQQDRRKIRAQKANKASKKKPKKSSGKNHKKASLHNSWVNNAEVEDVAPEIKVHDDIIPGCTINQLIGPVGYESDTSWSRSAKPLLKIPCEAMIGGKWISGEIHGHIAEDSAVSVIYSAGKSLELKRTEFTQFARIHFKPNGGKSTLVSFDVLFSAVPVLMGVVDDYNVKNVAFWNKITSASNLGYKGREKKRQDNAY